MIRSKVLSVLGLCWLAVGLVNVEKIDFTELRKKTESSDGNLVVHCKELEDAGYIKVQKKFVNRKPLTRYAATAKGKKALADYATKLFDVLKAQDVSSGLLK